MSTLWATAPVWLPLGLTLAGACSIVAARWAWRSLRSRHARRGGGHVAG